MTRPPTEIRKSDMKRNRRKFRQSLIGKCALSLLIPMGFIGTSFAEPQFDAPYYQFQKSRGDVWAEEDKAIDEKLVALEKK